MIINYKNWKKLKTREQGAAAVEFAILLPILIMIVFGIFQFGIAYNNYIALTHAAREGARLAAIGGDYGYIEERVTNMTPTVQIASIEIEPYNPEDRIVGDSVTVTVTGEVLRIDIPLVTSRDIQLSSRAAMRVEYNVPLTDEE